MIESEPCLACNYALNPKTKININKNLKPTKKSFCGFYYKRVIILKKVFISGASGAIGSAIAKKFLDNGYTVIAHYNTDKTGIDALKNYAESQNALQRIFIVQADLSNSEQVSNMLDNLTKSFKSIDVIVNNAGIGLYKLITDTTESEWDKLFAVNIKSAYQINNAFIGGMISKGQGKIINISSMWGSVGASMEVAYSASKAALIGYTKALAKELAPSNINVNCICPGVINTPMNARFSKEEVEELINETPLGKLGEPIDVANAVWFLSQEQSSFITGQIITIDGGFTL